MSEFVGTSGLTLGGVLFWVAACGIIWLWCEIKLNDRNSDDG